MIPVPVRFRSPAFKITLCVILFAVILFCNFILYVRVAQLDRALHYGCRCREFESSRARFLKIEISQSFFVLSFSFLKKLCMSVFYSRFALGFYLLYFVVQFSYMIVEPIVYIDKKSK